MKLLITLKLADRNMMHHLYPITLLDEVDKLIVVRDTKGPDINKFQYHCPPYWTLKIPIIALLYKFVLMIILSIREKPELIHGYLMFPHGILAFVVGKLTRKKVGISLLAGPVELYAPGRSPIGKYSYCRPLPPLNFSAKIFLHILDKCDIITVTGSYTKKYLENKGVKNDTISVLPHAVDNKFKHVNSIKEYDIVFVGRLAGVKHVETLIKSIDIVRRTYEEVRVAIVGDGECKTKLEELTRELGLMENIFFAGYQSNSWNWYNKGKMSILTSEREGFPYSVVEALSCGLPVISSNCGNVSDIIKHGYNGFIIDDYQDHISFAEAILEFLQNPETLLEFSNNAAKSVRDLNEESVTNVWNTIINAISK
ncbi:glycosyltransferase [Methanococcoides alaskense]|uniref:Glycosyltransferase involved in cell wall biosynthesis n=1 Tax=Methanococcoides alaskense TaxID=325778 RepID=A0AA90TYU2_9EURY|nr:glycosyltransferase [Methanococcoides alaskense]MDA0524647.1 glycosyltransferase [Methanococcoides alaskense]MDR6222430.1 glycosyltransferase involved in cell wall biosynthesis [Methanococcoides alaskense]